MSPRAGGLLARSRAAANAALGVSGILPLIGWAVGISRLPSGATGEIGLWLIAIGSVAILLGLALDLLPASGRTLRQPKLIPDTSVS